MSHYQLISKTFPKAKMQHSCIWCPEKIEIGEKYIHEIGKYDDLQNHRWHLECYNVAIQFFAENPHETEIYPHECKKGSLEHA